jgi:ABC-type transporter Mla subunit MlaD
MPNAAISVLASFHAGSVLTLVLPLGVLIAVVLWYVWLWSRGAGER